MAVTIPNDHPLKPVTETKAEDKKEARKKQKQQEQSLASVTKRIVVLVSMFALGVATTFLHKPSTPLVKAAKTEKIPTVTFSSEFGGLQETANDVQAQLKDGVHSVAAQVLGTATQALTMTASHSAEKVTGFVYQNTAEGIAKQINKLPTDQQTELKKAICR